MKVWNMMSRTIASRLCVCLFLFIDVVCGGDAGNGACDIASACLQTMDMRITATLQTNYNRTFLPNTETYYRILATRDEVCKDTNQETTTCLLTNLPNCPTIKYTDKFPANITSVTTPGQLCSNLRLDACEARDQIFRICYTDILPEIVTGAGTPTTVARTCQSDNRDSMNCLLESYKECDSVIFQDVLQNFGVLKDEIFLNQWKRFNDGGEICSCAIKSSCQSFVDSQLLRYAFGGFEDSVSEEYDKVLGYAENLCRIKGNVDCSYTGFSPLCSDSVYSDRVANYKRYFDFTQAICTSVESQEFINNRACVLSQLTAKLASCRNVLPSTARNLNCTEMENWHTCFELAIDGICGDLSNTVYEIFLDFYEMPKFTFPCNSVQIHRTSISTILVMCSFLLMFFLCP